MTAALGYVAAGLLVVIAVLASIDGVVRLAARRNERIRQQLRPAAITVLGEYLAEDAHLPCVEGTTERAVMLQVGLEALGDLQGAERDRIADMLDRLGFVEEARAGLRSRRRAARRRAAEALALIGTPSAVAALGPALADRDVLVRTAAARLLAEVGDDEAARAVVAVAEQDARLAPGAVAAVILALAKSHEAAVGQMLRPGADARVKAIAISVAGALRLASLGPALRVCLTESDDIAAAAATGLGRIGETMAVPALMALACDESRAAEVRTAAAAALGAIADPAAVPALGALLGAEDWSLRTAAAQGLAGLGADPPEPPVVSTRGDDPPEPSEGVRS